jgi:hypothetical protein
MQSMVAVLYINKTKRFANYSKKAISNAKRSDMAFIVLLSKEK